MKQITKLQQQMDDIESSITTDMTTKEIYNQLIVAYNIAKDIIVLQSDSVETIPDTDHDLLLIAQDDIKTLREENNHYVGILAGLKLELQKLVRQL